ncbi:MAG: BON domain-containing protein [Rhodopirellula sp.]|nr:BON domain-containing protein [Rhodopirellula sp.]
MLRQVPRMAMTRPRGAGPPEPVGAASHVPSRDDTLANHAKETLYQRDFRFSRCVTCESRDGVLVLRGRVPSYYLKQLAQATVADIGGIRQIDNRLDVFVGTASPPQRPR